MRRLLSIVFSSLLLFTVCFSFTAFAHDKKGHNTDLEEVLLGTDYNLKSKSQKIQKTVEALETASYLALDQFNGNGESDLELLKQQGITGLPKSISEIDFKSNSLHRSFTHRGWDHFYTNDAAHWNIRKRILKNTVDAKFDFRKNDDKKDRLNDKCDSFAALLYYVHVLGDHIEDTKYTTGDLKIGLGGRNDDESIIAEIIKHSEVLFDNPKSFPQRTRYFQRLKSVDKKLKKVVQSTGGVNSPEEFEQYHACGEELLVILKEEVPKLLRREEFFSKVFY